MPRTSQIIAGPRLLLRQAFKTRLAPQVLPHPMRACQKQSPSRSSRTHFVAPQTPIRFKNHQHFDQEHIQQPDDKFTGLLLPHNFSHQICLFSRKCHPKSTNKLHNSNRASTTPKPLSGRNAIYIHMYHIPTYILYIYICVSV